MKAKLAHSIDLDKLIDRLSALVGSNIEPLSKALDLLTICNSLLKMEQDDSAEHVHELLDRVRKRLAEIDDSLLEVSTLLEGYINNVMNTPKPNIEPPPPAVQSPPPPQPVAKPGRVHEYKPQHVNPIHHSEYE